MCSGNIIILNGTSSSGKTSLVHALQDQLAEPYLEAGLDKFLWMLPQRYLQPPLWNDVLGLASKAGPIGNALVASMHQAIVTLSRSGSHVIADHVLVEPQWLQDSIRLFSDLPAYFIGVRCPLEVLEQREKSRKNRTLGQVRAQYELVHAHGFYDLEVDTSLTSPEGCAAQIIALMHSGKPPQAFQYLKLRLTG